MQGAAVIGERSQNVESGVLLDTLALAIMSDPTSVQEARLLVKDPEWKHDPDAYSPTPTKESKNTYGWDGVRYLGRENIREAD
jgi:hypothetical protein